jgi:hypothetical protein
MIDDHPIERARERYGLDLTTKDLAGIVLKISAGDSMLIQNDSVTGHQRHLVLIDGIAAQVVFCPKHMNIVTFLPRNAKCRRS